MSASQIPPGGRSFAALLAGVALVGGAVAALLLFVNASALRRGEAGADAGGYATQLSGALQELAQERREREALAGEVGELRARLERMEQQLARSEFDPPATPPGSAAETEVPAAEGNSPVGQPPAFDSVGLLQSGIDEGEAERLRELWSEIELEKLYVLDQAEREGWSRARRHQELQALQESVRDTLDEESYDRYLFAVRTPNRVVVRDVIDRSPAENAGILPGDIVLSYDGQRIFGRMELREATSLGQEGEVVRLEIIRGGRSQILVAPAGPLGMLLMSQLHEPR